MLTVLTAGHFDEVVQKHELIVLDFSANWCAPCKTFATVCVLVAEKHKDVAFFTIDVEQEKALAETFSVTSVPFLAIIRQGIVVFKDSGLQSENALSTLIDQAKALDMDDVVDNAREE